MCRRSFKEIYARLCVRSTIIFRRINIREIMYATSRKLSLFYMTITLSDGRIFVWFLFPSLFLSKKSLTSFRKDRILTTTVQYYKKPPQFSATEAMSNIRARILSSGSERQIQYNFTVMTIQ